MLGPVPSTRTAEFDSVGTEVARLALLNPGLARREGSGRDRGGGAVVPLRPCSTALQGAPTRTDEFAASCRRRRPPGRARCSRPGSTYLRCRGGGFRDPRGQKLPGGTGPRMSHLSNRARPQTHRRGTRSRPPAALARGSSGRPGTCHYNPHPWRSARLDIKCSLSPLRLHRRGRPVRHRYL